MQSFSILDTIGNTPLVQFNKVLTNFSSNLYLKFEKFNPAGSIKDRPALYIIEQAEAMGLIKPGCSIIESSSGNFGISLAMIGAVKGYKVIILVDPKTTATNLKMLKAYGAEVIVVTEQDDSGSYHKTRIALANKLHKEIANSFRPDQCFNLTNSEAHYASTAPELFSHFKDRSLDYIVVSASTGGQIGGISKYVAQHSPQTKVIAVDVAGSTIFSGVPHPYLTPGVGLSWTPNNISDLSLIDAVYKVTDEQVFLSCRTLAVHEGILLGGSSGACAFVGLQLAQSVAGKNIAIIAADGGEKYLDSIYNDEWMSEHKLLIKKDLSLLLDSAKSLRPHNLPPVQLANYKPELFSQLRA